MKDHVVIAPDKFKGSLTAPQVAAHVASGLAAAGFGAADSLAAEPEVTETGPLGGFPVALPSAAGSGPLGDGVPGASTPMADGGPSDGEGVSVVLLPVADGGDGTVDAVVASGFTRVDVEVTGPTGERVLASYALQAESGDVPDGRETGTRDVRRTAVVELAEASGLRRLPGGTAPLTATSYGTGELIAHAVRQGATRVVLGLGGSACTDGGAGMVQALGVRLLDENGDDLPFGGAALRDLARIDTTGFGRLAPRHSHGLAHSHDHAVGSDHSHGHGHGHDHEEDVVDLSDVEFVVASDVDNPLLGPNGAAAVYGPQKGATPEDVAVLAAGLARLAAIAVHTHGLVGAVEHDGVVRGMGVAGQPGAGAAGGVGFAALAFLHAEISPGIEFLLGLLDFDRRVEGARLVITGEGSLDEQSLHGKAPLGVASAAAEHGVPVVAVCGRRTIEDERLHAAGISAAYALTDIEPDVERCVADAGPLLERLARTIAATHLATT